jgi:transglutaminase-like putative cysteine protease
MMKIRLWLQAAFTLAALTLPASLWGQFQPPTDEELKMTAEPKAPGAAAIYLYREEVDDDNLNYESSYVRVKVLTEKGKELATVSVPYPKGAFSVTDIKARTIHSDGTVIPLNIKPTDLVDQKAKGYQINKMVFTLPSVEVGSILEYRWELRYDDEFYLPPTWRVQQDYFVRKAHYSFLPYKNATDKLTYSSMLSKDSKIVYVDSSGKYTLDVIDVPATPDEEFMPPIDTLLKHVEFYYSPYSTKDEFWKHEGGKWSKEMDRFASESKTLKEAISKLVAPGDTEDAKAHKLYDAVMALENTDYTRRKSQAELKQLHMKQAKDAEDVWTRKSGSSDEIALLYLAMARIAGLKAYALAVCDRNRELFNPYYLSTRQLDDVLVLLTINGKEIPVDPGTRFAEFGELDWTHNLASGLRQTDKGAEFASTTGNPYKDAVTMRVADVTIAHDGSVTGTVRMAMKGPAALHWRKLVIQNEEDEVKKQFNEQMKGMVPDGVTADFDHFVGLDDYHSQLIGVVKLSGNMGTATGKRVFLPGVFFESRSKHPFVAEDQRQTPVDMKYSELVQDQVTYHLPDGFNVESAPADATIPWAGHAALQLKSTPDKNDIHLDRSLVRGFSMVAATDYPAMRDFYQKMATADQQQLVLTAASTAKGN